MTEHAASYPAPWVRQLDFPMTAGVVFAIGDLVIVQSNKAVPGASTTDQGSEALNQAYAAPKFLGVAAMRKDTGNVDTTIDVDLEWIGTLPCASDTFVVGDYVTFCENGGTNGLESQKLKKTTDPSVAIGQVLLDYSSATTSIFVRLTSNFIRKNLASDLPNGVQGVGASYKIARGTGTVSAATVNINTGLTTVVSGLVQLKTKPTVNVLGLTTLGSTGGGNLQAYAFKAATAGGGVITPADSDTFSDALTFHYIAVGT